MNDVKKPKKAKNKKLLIAILAPAILFFAIVLMGSINSTRDYNSCVSNFRESAYKGRTDETKQEMQEINNLNLAKHKTTCSNFFLSQGKLFYLFNGYQREQSIKMYCDSFARDIELNAAKWKADPLSVVLPFYEGSNYDKSYAQCTHEFGI